MSSRELEDRQEKMVEERVAKELGITPEELSDTAYEIIDNSSDDGLIYSYFIVFSEESPKNILEKIGVDENNQIEVSCNLFDGDN